MHKLVWIMLDAVENYLLKLVTPFPRPYSPKWFFMFRN